MEQVGECISVIEAGKRLGLGRCTSYKLAQVGAIPALRLGRQLRVPLRAFERMLKNAGKPGRME